MEIDVNHVRKLFRATKSMNYLFNGGLALLSKPAQEAMRNTIAELENGIGVDNWQKINYLFNGRICLCSTVVQEEMRTFMGEVENGYSEENWEKWTFDAQDAYSIFARLA